LLDLSQSNRPLETDAFRVLVVQDFDGVAVEDGAGEISGKDTNRNQ
jgi:hypothetical protein